MSMADRDGVIWYDGEFVPWRNATTHVLTHTLHYGLGIFEGVRAYKTDRGVAIFRLHEHTRRFFRSAKILGMSLPYPEDTINQACLEVLRRNELHEGGYLRPMAFYGSEGMGLRANNLKVHTIVAAWPWPAYLGDEGLEHGIRVRVSSFTRHHVNAAMARAKANGNYINSTLALQEALRDGFDEAILLDAQGFVAEGSGENLFLISEGVVYTPPLTSVLDGITRRTVMQLCAEEGLECREKLMTRDELYIADELFFTGTAAEVTPIREIDGRGIGHGQRGPITTRLQQRYFDVVYGREPKHEQWLSRI